MPQRLSLHDSVYTLIPAADQRLRSLSDADLLRACRDVLAPTSHLAAYTWVKHEDGETCYCTLGAAYEAMGLTYLVGDMVRVQVVLSDHPIVKAMNDRVCRLLMPHIDFELINVSNLSESLRDQITSTNTDEAYSVITSYSDFVLAPHEDSVAHAVALYDRAIAACESITQAVAAAEKETT